MRIVEAFPPNYKEILDRFDVGHLKVVFTYGDKIYNPHKLDLPFHVIKHEEIHGKQQEYSDEKAKIWWEKYLTDTEFMLSQEIEAYGAQYAICQKVLSAKQSKSFLSDLAILLSSEMYGNPISQLVAESKIRNAAKAFN